MPGLWERGSPGLTLDRYHIDSAYVSWRSGRNAAATFDLYARRAPFRGAYMLAAGLEPAMEFVRAFAFSEGDLAYLERMGHYDRAFLDELAGTRFTGDIDAMQEGTIAFPDEPLVRVTAPLREALLLESGLLHHISFPTLVATKAARVVHAAAGRPVAEFALRRAPEPFGVARAAAIAGCSSTSFLAAAAEFGLEASGTIPHALVQAFPAEEDAFRAVADALERYTFLLDTYDVKRAIDTAVEVARDAEQRTGHKLIAVRLDSGDLATDARHVRGVLNEAGLRDVQILASGDLDEFSIDELIHGGAPIDAFGVGTTIGTAAGSPERRIPGSHLHSVYKLVASADPGVPPPIKEAVDKSTWPGLKQVYRVGDFEEDVIALDDEQPPARGAPLLEPALRRGKPVGPLPTLQEARARAAACLEALPEPYHALIDPPLYPVGRSAGLQKLRDEARAHLHGG